MIDQPEKPPEPSDVKPVSILDEMKRSYLDYAMSVIVSRALPDVRDGLKPVHRRILFSMYEQNFTPERPYNKCARTTGDTTGRFHPHGDIAVYDAMVRMAQDFSMRAPLIDGQGNFGSVDGDPPAASRYTEARLEKITMTMLDDLDKDTVDYRPNYDEKELEPTVLPARFPNLLVNGAGGIAVGMATNIPPHNLGESIDAVLALMEKPDMSVEELMEHLPGPDFPDRRPHPRPRRRARRLLDRARLDHHACAMSRWRSCASEREALVVTEIPYQLNKIDLDREDRRTRARQEASRASRTCATRADREGMRIVIELKRDAVADVVLEPAVALHVSCRRSFGANMIALNGGRPEMMTLQVIS